MPNSSATVLILGLRARPDSHDFSLLSGSDGVLVLMSILFLEPRANPVSGLFFCPREARLDGDHAVVAVLSEVEQRSWLAIHPFTVGT